MPNDWIVICITPGPPRRAYDALTRIHEGHPSHSRAVRLCTHARLRAYAT